MAKRRVYLIRHGEYDWNNDPSPLKGLTARGVEQARWTAQRLRFVPATAIYSSDLMRAVETAEMIRAEHDGIPYKKRKELRECFLASPPFSSVPVDMIQAGEKQAAKVFSKYLRPSRRADKICWVKVEKTLLAINPRADLADTLNAPVSPRKVRRGVQAPGVSLHDAMRPRRKTRRAGGS